MVGEEGTNAQLQCTVWYFAHSSGKWGWKIARLPTPSVNQLCSSSTLLHRQLLAAFTRTPNRTALLATKQQSVVLAKLNSQPNKVNTATAPRSCRMSATMQWSAPLRGQNPAKSAPHLCAHRTYMGYLEFVSAWINYDP